MSVTIRDVAKASKVSVYTVSSVLHNKKDVSQATRERVLRIIRELNYDPLRNIPLAREARTRTIGLIIPYTGSGTGTFFYRAMAAAQKATSALGYGCKLFSEEDIAVRTVDNYQAGKAQFGCDAMILFCTNLGWQAYAESLLSWDMPVALVRRSLKRKGIITLHDDDTSGGRMIMEHLANAGHRVIAMVGETFQTGQSPERYHAYRQVIKERQLCDDPRLVIRASEYNHDPGQRILALREQNLAVTAACCYDDTVAAQTISTLGRAGLRVPDDVAVTGYDDNPLAEQIYPALTTVHIPVEEMVAAACRALVNHDPERNTASIDMTFENKLIIRESCGTIN